MPDIEPAAYPEVKTDERKNTAVRFRLPAWIATTLAAIVLRLGNWPGRQLVGLARRTVSRRRGGRSFRVRAADGTRLAAWHVPADHNVPRRAPIVMLHGWMEVKEFHFHRAYRFARRGHDVIMFDHRGHGVSGGRIATFGVREREDLTTVINEAVRRRLIDPHVITVGFSMGAATALQHAGDDPRVIGVVAFAPYVDFREAILSFRDLLAPRIEDRWLLQGFHRAARRAGFTLDQTSTLEPMKKLDKPVLLIEATKDRNLPPHRHIKPLIDAKTRGPLELFTVEGATHVGLCRKSWPGLDEAVDNFCDSFDGQPT